MGINARSGRDKIMSLMRPQSFGFLLNITVAFGSVYAYQSHPLRQVTLGYRSAHLLSSDGLQFKDLNHNGKLDAYEDWRKTPSERASDLVHKMSVEDLAGVMVHGTLPAATGTDAAIGMGS